MTWRTGAPRGGGLGARGAEDGRLWAIQVLVLGEASFVDLLRQARALFELQYARNAGLDELVEIAGEKLDALEQRICGVIDSSRTRRLNWSQLSSRSIKQPPVSVLGTFGERRVAGIFFVAVCFLAAIDLRD